MPTDARTNLENDGFTVIPGLLDESWCERLRAAIEQTREEPSEHYGVLSPPDRPRVDSDLFRWFDDPTIAELTTASPLVDLAADLLDSAEIVLVEDQWFSSAPGAATPSPWHQDEPYYNLDRPFLTIWITLDPIGDGSSLRVVPGSHLGPLYAPVEFSATGDTIGAGGGLPPVPDVDNGEFDICAWSLDAGDAIAIDSRLLHATGPTPMDDRPFRRISTRWAHPATRYADRGAQVANFWHLLPHGLEPGDLVAGDVFPLRRAS